MNLCCGNGASREHGGVSETGRHYWPARSGGERPMKVRASDKEDGSDLGLVLWPARSGGESPMEVRASVKETGLTSDRYFSRRGPVGSVQ